MTNNLIDGMMVAGNNAAPGIWWAYPAYHLVFALLGIVIGEVISNSATVVVTPDQLQRRLSGFARRNGRPAFDWQVALPTISAARLERPGYRGLTHGILSFRARGWDYVVGIPRDLPVEAVAECLHHVGVSVALEDWQPPPPVEPIVSDLIVERIDDDQALSPGRRFWIDIVLANAVGVPLLLLAVACFVGAWWYAPLLGSAGSVGCVLAGVLILVVAVWHEFGYGSLLPYAALRRLAWNVLSQRRNAWVYPNDPDVWWVEVIPRANWYRPRIHHYDDVGLVRYDHKRRCWLYEGLRERWRAPQGALAPITMAKVSPHGDEAMLVHHYVAVLSGRSDGKAWERPLCPLPPGGWKRENNKRRRQRAKKLLAALTPHD